MKSNFTFAYSRSTSVYDRNKDAKKTSKLSFKEKHGSIDELVNDVKMGYAFCGTFNHAGATFGLSSKSQANFKSTNLIVFDMDAVKFTAGEFYGKTIATDYTPSIIYTTANDGHFKEGKDESYCNRYRVIYVTDEPITSVEQYTQIHQALKRDLASYVGDVDNIFNDNTDKDASHFFAGCSDTECYHCNRVVSLTWLADKYNVVLTGANAVDECNDNGIRTPYNDNHLTMIEASAHEALVTNTNDKSAKKLACVDIRKQEKQYYTTQTPKIALFADFINDYENTDKNYHRLSFEYSRILPRLPEETPVELDKGKLYKEVDENHIRILRKRHKVIERGASGNEIEKWKPIKFKDGQRRREKLYIYLQMLKAITQSATYEELLWMATNFIVEQVDNTKDPITKDDVIKAVNNALSREWKPSAKSVKKYGKKVVTNKALARKKGITNRLAGLAAVHEWKRDLKLSKWEQISTLYDPSKTIKENAQLMNDAGLKVTENYIKEWKRENGLTGDRKSSKADRIATYYDNTLTDEQNIEQLAVNGVKVSLRTLKTWKKENGYTKQRSKSTSKANRATTSADYEIVDEVISQFNKVQQGANMADLSSVDIEELTANFLNGKKQPINDGTRYNDDEETIYFDDGTEVILPW